VYFANDIKKNVDWGHHVIRNAVLKMNAERYLLQNAPRDHLDQKIKTLIDPARSEIEYVQYKDYKKSVSKLDATIKDNIKNSGNKPIKLRIPIIVFTVNKGNSDYDKYRKVIKSLCESVINKLKTRDNLQFCPIECLIYCHLMEMTQHPYDITVNIMDIYKILSYYNEAPHEHSEEYGCKCNEFFTNKCSLNAHANIRASIINHHKAVAKIDIIMKKFVDLTSVSSQEIKFKVDISKQWNTDTFVLKNRIDICTQPLSDGTIYCVKLVAQFNNMNYITVLSEIVFNRYMLLKNPDIKNVNYFIVTLDHFEPIEVVEQPELNHYLSDYFKKHGNNMHAKVFKYFQYYCKDKDSGVRDVLTEMEDNYGNTMPTYILDTVKEIDKNYKRKRGVTWDNLNDPSWFCEQLQDNLEYEIKTSFNKSC
jgi:hypothetical protein